jgi:hypothetical protein
MSVQFHGFPEALNAMNNQIPRIYSPLSMQRTSTPMGVYPRLPLNLKSEG